MGLSRIADAHAPKAVLAGTTTKGVATHIGELVASPLGVLILLPALVAFVGGFLALSNERALRKSNTEAAEARLFEQARLVARSVHAALSQADPMLDRIATSTLAHDPQKPLGPFAHVLADAMAGRAGVAYVSASFPDGTFQGAYVDEDGSLRFQDSRIHADGTHVRRFDLAGADALRPYATETTTYDPRTRGFYALAVARGRRVFTEPYPFFGTLHTGVTRAMPLYKAENGVRTLHAVITVDFDVHAMSRMLEEQGLPGTRALLHAPSGAVLAYSHAPEDVRASGDAVLTYRDLHDPVLDAFFARGARRGQIRAAGEDTYLVATASASDETLGWQVAFMTPERVVLAPLRKYERRSAIVASGAMIFSVMLAYVFARHITRTERAAEAARVAAQEAHAVARELGSYRLTTLLGKGGMGEVWRAEHRLLARSAAIKLINPDVSPANREELRTRFRREAEALAGLRSRNTIEIYDYGVTEDGTFFYVMEMLDGVDLETLVLAHGPQPAERVAKLLLQVCGSLAEAHEAGMVHRDIKPANVFVCRAADELDIVKVLDFGLVKNAVHDERARPVDADALAREVAEAGDASALVTRVGGLLGTPAFMPKEQALGEPLDGRADLYALGGVAFFLLTGKLVHDHPNPMTMLFMHVHLPLPDLRAALPTSVPDAMVDIIARCLAKEPSERPASARELASLLRALSFAGEACFSSEDAARFWASRAAAQSEHARQVAEISSAPTLVSLG